MGQQLQPLRPGNDERLWLSMLIEAMNKAADPELRGVPCDLTVLAALSAQLARPASPSCCPFPLPDSACLTSQFA
jgi:hypothetical protein